MPNITKVREINLKKIFILKNIFFFENKSILGEHEKSQGIVTKVEFRYCILLYKRSYKWIFINCQGISSCNQLQCGSYIISSVSQSCFLCTEPIPRESTEKDFRCKYQG